MEQQKYTIKEIEVFRKYHYWRGFRACLILIVVPIVITILVAMQLFVNANT